MLFEIITIDASMKRIIPFASSGIALIIQLLVTYISKLLINSETAASALIPSDCLANTADSNIAL